MGRLDEENEAKKKKKMIHREIQSISSMEERVAFKELMEGVFLSLHETNRQMYAALKQRIEEELDYGKNHYHIRTGVIEREYFDASHYLLSPMDERDLHQKTYDMKEILQAVTQEGEFCLMKVMLCCDFLEIQRLWERQPVFEGIIETKQPEREWRIQVRLRENKDYLQKIEYLYFLFVRNRIPWRTVNAAYLYKIADVSVTGLPKEITGNEKIKQVSIQFGEYSRIVKKDMIPVWNVQKLMLDGIGFPIPCMDHVNYEHSISLRDYGTDNAYLVEDDRKVQSVSQIGEKLRIVCGYKKKKKWNVYRIRSSQERKIDRYTYPVLGNERAESFAEKYERKWNQTIRTKTELEHFLKGFGLEDYVRYQDCRVEDRFPDQKQTYSMNSFIAEEIRNREAQKKMILFFRPGSKEKWLQRDILSFLVSETQRIYPEYDCGGVLL